VIGAGLSGLACAQRLAAKRYDVAVFERESAMGSSLDALFPDGAHRDELALQLSAADYTAAFDAEIRALDGEDMSGFDAVYVATGAGGRDFGLLASVNPQTLATEREGVFLGGMLAGGDHVKALADGLTAAVSIETYLKIKSMPGDEELLSFPECRIKPRENKDKLLPLIPGNGVSYTEAEAVEEAGHCLFCDCTACYDSCEYMKEQGLTPRQLEARAINERGVVGRVSTRQIASCALCGHCEAVCDYDASVERALRRGKQLLFESGGFVPVYHDFYLRDMEDAMNASFLCKAAPGYKDATYLFFPGCYAGKTNPDYVRAPYRYMREHDPDTALMLACCGVPALYAGDLAKMSEVHERIKAEVENLSGPTMVLSCATCAKTFDEFLPELRWISFYEYLCEKGLPSAAPLSRDVEGGWALFDPCSSRRFPGMQEAVRDSLGAAGVAFRELPENRARTLCCGQGGHIYAANPHLAKKFTEAALRQSDAPYLAYCVNCRDLFLENGKETVHALDLLFGLEPLERPVHLAQKNLNRRSLPAALLGEFWGESGGEAPEEDPGNVRISEALLTKMDGLLLSKEDACGTIESCEAGGEYLINEERGTRIGQSKRGQVTCWVEYRPCDDGWELVNIYSHRIEFSPRKLFQNGLSC
jgi:Fe-S oxidoreductase